MNFLDKNGLLYVWQKIKTYVENLLKGKVDAIEGKGLSTNDYTTAEKNKLADLNNYVLPTASADTLGGIKVGAGLAINEGVLSATGGGTADSVDWANVQNRPTKVSEFTNDSGYLTSVPSEYVTDSELTGKGYQTASQVNSAITSKGYQTEAQVSSLISNAIADIQGIEYSIVTQLPSTGEAGVIYLISNSGSNPNSYDEYIYVNSKFEKIGTTDVDLSGYVQDTDLVAITNSDIDSIIAS